MSAPLTDPVDGLHAASVTAVRRIRAAVAALRAQAATWEPAPCPPPSGDDHLWIVDRRPLDQELRR